MKIIVTLGERQARRYLINLLTKSIITEVKCLIAAQNYAGAIDLVCRGGSVEREILDGELPSTAADLILSGCSASWDVVK